MNSRPAAIAVPAAVLAAAVVCGGALAVDAQAYEQATPTPPVVVVKPSREGTQASADGIIRRHRENESSGKTRTPAPTKTTRPAGDKRPEGGQRRDDARQSVDDDRLLNIGICGRVQPDGSVPGPVRCQPGGDERRVTRRTVPPEIVRPRPQDVTWEQVRSETKDIVFPGLSVKVQPAGRTLVNLDTIVYTTDSKVSTTTVTLLGFPVVVEATPISYTWQFGDGSPALTTSTPGKPYPSKEITHKYMKRGAVNVQLTTNYAARFNVADTGWQYIDGTVPITGPATPLQVREAVPVLVDPGR
jgi:hypothetical protein